MKTALFYENPRPLNAASDADLRVREITDLSFARGTNTIPINLAEFGLAARHYPIGFVGESATPMAIVGLQDSNVFVGDDGRWKAGAYVPAFVRRYPFIFADTGTPEQYSLCIDDTPAAVSTAEGRPLFVGGGLSPLTAQAMEFCRGFHAGAQATETFAKAMKAAGLLVERRAETRLAAGASFTLTGFRSIDEAKLRKVPGRTLAQWNEKGWLGPIFLHLQSMANWNDMMALIPQIKASRVA
jgi:hypothetical protein